MEINLTEINRFFSQYKTRPMPKMVMEMILSGKNLKHSGLETYVLSWNSLNLVIAPEIASSIDVASPSVHIPILYYPPTLRHPRKSQHFAYDPSSGLYKGTFKAVGDTE